MGAGCWDFKISAVQQQKGLYFHLCSVEYWFQHCKQEAGLQRSKSEWLDFTDMPLELMHIVGFTLCRTQ